ncbi:unnamed protein product [Hymenolepis diminuta]|uniref:Uncharacterized protein n=1 Tax=Hymenolepis diminuta TaxID=6216 RepID=A0A564YQ12_HYMDI|nr:unnamed protein product [Hymenolepis diminuta]
MRPNITKAKRQPPMLRPVVRSKLHEKFVQPVLLHGFSTIVYFKVDDNKIKAVQNTGPRMVLGLYRRKQMSVEVLTEKFAQLHNYISIGQKR